METVSPAHALPLDAPLPTSDSEKSEFGVINLMLTIDAIRVTSFSHAI